MSIRARIVICLVVLLIVISIMVFQKFKSDMKNAGVKLNSLSTKVYNSKYGDIEYSIEGDGPTILVSHGVTGGIDQGMGLANLYIGKGYRILYVSRFGYLNSSMPANPSSKLQAAAYKELLDYLKIKEVFVFGNSAGGPSAMHFAIDYSDNCKGLILLSSAVPAPDKPTPPDIVFKSNFMYWLTTKIAGKSLMKMFIPENIIEAMSKEETRKTIDEIYSSALPISKRSQGILFDTKISNQSVNNISFEQIKVPTLIIHAVDDPAPPIAGARLISEKIQNSKLVTYNGGHLILHHEDEIRQEIKNFVSAKH